MAEERGNQTSRGVTTDAVASRASRPQTTVAKIDLPATAEAGRSLRSVLAERDHLAWREVVRIGIQVAIELDSEHRRGHERQRLITPDNILGRDDGAGYTISPPRATDVRAVSAAAAEYEAPELWRTPEQVDGRADQFSLGVVLFEALAGLGKRPFRVDLRRVSKPDSDEQPTIEVSHSPQHDLRDLAIQAPDSLVRALERATRLTPANRFETCAQFADALRAVGIPEPEPSTRTATRRRRSLWLGVGVTTIALVLAALIARYVQQLAFGLPEQRKMDAARQAAAQIAAQEYAAPLWREAETYQPAADYDERSLLYARASEAAWRAHLAAVSDAAKHAMEFEAVDEPAYTQATLARSRAEQQWAAHRFEDALSSLREASNDLQTAVSARRSRWAAQIRTQLAAEVAKVTQNVSNIDLATLRSQQASVEKAITDRAASPDDFRFAESAVADIRHAVAVALAEAGAVEVARRSAEEAVGAADLARREAQPWAENFEHAKAPYDRGTAFLLSARDALERDPSRALALADAATDRFHSVQAAGQSDIATERQAATAARRRAERQRADERATALYGAGAKAMERAEEGGGGNVAGALEQHQAYALAKQKFDEAAAAAARAERAQGAALRREPRVRSGAQRPEVMNPAPTAQPTAARAAEPSPKTTPQNPFEPMSPDLARQIQRWLSQYCGALNRGLPDASARCENLIVYDRRDVGQVRVSYTVTRGTKSNDGIDWETPAKHEVLLDCTGSNCRCIAGPDC